MPAHKTWDDVRLGVLSRDDLIGNQVADLIAGAFAEEGQLPETVVSSYRQANEWAWMVQDHLCGAMVAAAALYPGLKRTRLATKKAGKGPRSRVKTPRQMGHQLKEQMCGHRCTRCLVWKGRSGSAYWRRTACSTSLGAQVAPSRSVRPPEGTAAPSERGVLCRFGDRAVHTSHTFGYCRGILWCWKCGAWTQGGIIVKLLECCPRRPNAAGEAVLRRLSKQLTPTVQSVWPLAGGEFPPFEIAHLVQDAPAGGSYRRKRPPGGR